MTNIKYILTALWISLFFLSCYEDKILKDGEIIVAKDHPSEYVSASVTGSIRDEYGNAMTDITVAIQDKVYSSKNGFYYFYLEKADKNGVQVIMTKDKKQYLFTVKPLGEDVNYFSHTIITKPNILTVPADEAVNLQLSGGVGLKIEPNAFLYENKIYSGSVSVQSFLPDLLEPMHLQALPGGHLALDTEGEQVWLDIFQAVYLNWTSDDGRELSLKERSARLALDFPGCENCKMWCFDDKINKWLEIDKSLNTGGGAYFIDKSGFYCLAKPYVYNLVEGKVNVKDKYLVNQPVDIYLEQKLVERVYTSNTGKWFAHLPMNKNYNYKVEPACNMVSEGIFTVKDIDETVLPPIEIDAGLQLIEIKGEIRNCANDLQGDNFILCRQGGQLQYFFSLPAVVDKYIPDCNTGDITITIADENWKNTTPENIFLIKDRTVNFNKIYSCNDIKLDGYFLIKIDGEEKLFKVTQADWTEGRTKITVYDIDNIGMTLELWFSGRETRRYSDSELNIYFDHLVAGGKEYAMYCRNSKDGCGFTSFVIESYGEKRGDWIKGKFEGDFWIKTYTPLSADYKKVEGEFMVPRIF